MTPSVFPQDRTVVVTGAASDRGIGRVTADKLASQGWHVAVLDLSEEVSGRVAAELTARYDVKSVGIGVDVSDQASVNAAIDRVEASLPQIVGLANIAGISSPTPFLEETADGWNKVFAVNLTGVFFVTQRVARTMVKNSLGRIVSVSSVSYQRGGGTFSKSAYSASKAGVVGLMRSVARELGRYGVTANSISPGPVDTDIMGGTLTEERKAGMSKDTLIGRVGTPADMAALMAFLLGEDAGNITGATYDTNGGLHLS